MINYLQHDIALSQIAILSINDEKGNPRNIKFQWPPKVSSDNRKGQWTITNMSTTEPAASYYASSARSINLNWTYVVDGGLWNIKSVSEEVKFLRGYFARIRSDIDRRQMIIKCKFWMIGGSKPTTARIMDINIKHGDTLVTELSQNTSISASNIAVTKQTDRFDNTYPLRTDISVTIDIWNDKTGQIFKEPLTKSTPEWH